VIRTTAAVLAVVLSLAAVDAGAGSAAPAEAAKIESRTLANGLKVVVWPDHDIPNVAVYLWFRVGSRNEYPGITGISHFFEHMMFNGTRTRAPGEFDRIMEGNGGRNNAYTSSDVTVYQDWFPRSALELVFDLEADRMRNLDFDPKAVESERGVVYSERRLSTKPYAPSFVCWQIRSAEWMKLGSDNSGAAASSVPPVASTSSINSKRPLPGCISSTPAPYSRS